MIVTDEEKLHWRFVSITIKVSHEHLDLDLLNRALGSDTRSPIVRMLQSTDAGTSYSHAFIFPAATRDGGDGFNETIIEIDTYRFGNTEGDHPARALPDTEFFNSLRNSIHGVEQLSIISATDLSYPATEASWRMSMLADPPKLDEFESEIGKIALSGVKLRFTDSPHGLLESSLEISPAEDEYRCSLTLLHQLRAEDLAQIREIVIRQAEEFAQLFVEVSGGS